MGTAKVPCDQLGRKHKWRERDEWYGSRSTQSVGKYWVCAECGKREEAKPDGVS